MHRGYVKVWRKIRDSGIIEDGPSSQVFLKAITDTAWRKTTKQIRGRFIELEIGEFIFGRKEWANDLKLSEKVLRRVISNFQKRAIIRAVTRASTHTVYSFVNWDTYQAKDDSEGPSLGPSLGPSKGQHRATSEEEKKRRTKELSLLPEEKTKAVPFEELRKLYNESFKDEKVAQCRVVSEKSKSEIRARWNGRKESGSDTLEYWKDLFTWLKSSRFLMGHIPPSGDFRQFRLKMEWIFNTNNYAKILNEDFHGENGNE